MRYHSFAATVALTVFALLGPADSVEAGGKSRFRGRFEGDVTITPLDPPFAFVLVDAAGKANKLGRFTLTIPHTVNFATSTGTGSYEFTARNGDTLSADFTGQATPIAGTAILYIEETATITGGTGWFARATGGFTAERLFDTVSGTTTGSFKGTISTRGRGDDDDDDDDSDDDRDND